MPIDTGRPVVGTFVRLAFPLVSDAFWRKAKQIGDPERITQTYAIVRETLSEDAKSYVHAPFRQPVPSRFSDGSYGMLYASDCDLTAARETSYHLAQVYPQGKAPPLETARVRLQLKVDALGVDIRRGVTKRVPSGVYDPVDWNRGQHYGAKIRKDAQAVHFDSVRNSPDGRCVGMFVPQAVRAAKKIGMSALVWDGKRFSEHHQITFL